LKGALIIKNLEKRCLDGVYCSSREKALQVISEDIPTGSIVSWGGSITLKQIGIRSILEKKECKIIDRDVAESPQERFEYMRRAMLSDYYFTSTNALTLDGELVNIDYNGNRVGAICFGPKKVIVIAGMNKVVQDVKSALARIRTEVCVPNCIRLGKKTPCASVGKCAECTGEESLCGQIVVTRGSMIKKRIKILLVGEHLGW
jgi:L-lactate utilization protein LutB